MILALDYNVIPICKYVFGLQKLGSFVNNTSGHCWMGLYPKEFAGLHSLPRSKRKTKKNKPSLQLTTHTMAQNRDGLPVRVKVIEMPSLNAIVFSAFLDLGPASPSQPQASILWRGLRQHESEGLCGFPQPWEGLVGGQTWKPDAKHR